MAILGRKRRQGLSSRIGGWVWPSGGWRRASRYLTMRLSRIPGTLLLAGRRLLLGRIRVVPALSGAALRHGGADCARHPFECASPRPSARSSAIPGPSPSSGSALTNSARGSASVRRASISPTPGGAPSRPVSTGGSPRFLETAQPLLLAMTVGGAVLGRGRLGDVLHNAGAARARLSAASPQSNRARARKGCGSMSNRLRLGVNVDHVATVRNARGTAYPEPGAGGPAGPAKPARTASPRICARIAAISATRTCAG